MPGRSFSSEKYRYGFNGQEKSDEIFANSTTALFWEYDSRIGRRWNVDPVPKTSISGYEVLGNNPNMYIDPLGDKRKDTKNSFGGYSAWEVDTKGNAVGLGMSGIGQNVTVTGKDKSRPWYNAIFGYNTTTRKTAQEWGAQRSDYYSARNNGLTTEDITKISSTPPERFKTFERGWQAEEAYRKMSIGAVVGMLAIPVALEAGIFSSTEYFLWKAGLDGAGQLVVNGGDWHQIDVWDMTLSGLSTPGASALFGGGVDIRLNGEVSIVGLDKSWQTATIDGVFKYAFGSKGVNSVPRTMIKKLTFSTPLSNLEKLVVERALSVPINMSGKAIRKAVKKQTGL